MSPVRWARRKSSSSESERNCYNVQTSQVTTERSTSKKDKKRIQEERRRSCEKRNPLLDKVKNTRLSFFKDRSSEDEQESTDRGQFNSMRDLEQLGLTRNDLRRSVCELDLKQMTEEEKTQAKRKKRSKSHSRVLTRKNNVDEQLSFLGFGTTTNKSCWSKNDPDNQPKSFSNDCSERRKSVDLLRTKPASSLDTGTQFDSVSSSSCLAAKFKAIQDRYFKTSTSRLMAKIYKKDGKDKESRRLRSFSYGALPGLDELRTNPLFEDQDQDDNDSGILDNGSATSSLLDDRCSSGASGLITNTTNDSSPPSLPLKKLSSINQIEQNILPTRNIIHQAANNELIQRTEFNGDVDISKQLPVIKSTTCTTETMVVKLPRDKADQSLGIFIAKTTESTPGYLVAHVVPNALADREGTLKIGDEILIVNGKRLRGLDMAEARKVVGCGGTVGDVDIVISRYINVDKPKVIENKLKESSVDYENMHLEIVNSPKLHFKKHSKHRDRKSECNRSIIMEKGRAIVNNGNQSVSNFCTLPRRPRSSVSTFHTVVFEKGPGKKSLGFTIVGGRDSPKGSIGQLFVMFF